MIERVGKGKKMQYLLLDLTGTPKSSCKERNSSPTDLILFPPSQGSVKGTTTHLVMQTRKPGVTVISLSSFTTSNQSLHFVFIFLIPHLPCFSPSPLHASLPPPPQSAHHVKHANLMSFSCHRGHKSHVICPVCLHFSRLSPPCSLQSSHTDLLQP